jgi:hypothetical protein
MSTARISLLFYDGISDSCVFKAVMDLGKLVLVPGARMEHCAVFIKFEDGRETCYHVGKGQKSYWVKGTVFHRKFKPDKGIYFGKAEVDINWMKNIKPIRFNFVGILVWYFITRWFTSWKPKDNCVMKACKLLQELQLDVKDHVVPTLLWKELIENANDNNCWESWSRKDHLGKDNS